ncbi:MAG: TIM barrel protein [Verrucomicrobiales bacterium]|nr:TIM barrel protein [Verrucomicrobiales bacterium]
MNFRLLALASALFLSQGTAGEVPENFRRENLIAWCIVPFDAAKRGPAERATMVKALGMRRVAYDWRKEHIPTFEAELQAYRNAGIEMTAFWSGHEDAYPLFRQFEIRPQIWKTLPSNEAPTQEGKVIKAAEMMAALAAKCMENRLTLGLYNHGGWGGEPANLVAVCRELRRRGFVDVGIVYNFHHAHERIDSWAEDLELIKPYLICLNLNGMVKDGPEEGRKILTIGKGDHEQEMIKTVVVSGYDGPIGILDHRNETDTEETVRENIEGLEAIFKQARE